MQHTALIIPAHIKNQILNLSPPPALPIGNLPVALNGYRDRHHPDRMHPLAFEESDAGALEHSGRGDGPAENDGVPWEVSRCCQRRKVICCFVFEGTYTTEVRPTCLAYSAQATGWAACVMERRP